MNFHLGVYRIEKYEHLFRTQTGGGFFGSNKEQQIMEKEFVIKMFNLLPNPSQERLERVQTTHYYLQEFHNFKFDVPKEDNKNYYLIRQKIDLKLGNGGSKPTTRIMRPYLEIIKKDRFKSSYEIKFFEGNYYILSDNNDLISHYSIDGLMQELMKIHGWKNFVAFEIDKNLKKKWTDCYRQIKDAESKLKNALNDITISTQNKDILKYLLFSIDPSNYSDPSIRSIQNEIDIYSLRLQGINEILPQPQ